ARAAHGVAEHVGGLEHVEVHRTPVADVARAPKDAGGLRGVGVERLLGPRDEAASQFDVLERWRPDQLASGDAPTEEQLAVAPQLRMRSLAVAVGDGDV